MNGTPGSPVESDAFDAAERQALLDEARAHLPLYLQGAAELHRDPVGDVEALAGLEEGELDRVVATHLCLAEQTSAFLRALLTLPAPASASTRSRERTRVVRGAIDWPATIRARATGTPDANLFVALPTSRSRDVPGNRALAWVLGQLRQRLRQARHRLRRDAAPGSWPAQLHALGDALDLADRIAWLKGVEPREPDERTYGSLAASRIPFYQGPLAQIARTLQAVRRPDDRAVVELLCERWFEPDKVWRLYEVVVALRLARAFDRAVGCTRTRRLLTGSERAVYARYELDDGDVVQLVRAGWPPRVDGSARVATARRHGFTVRASKPDLVVHRQGRRPDCVVLELKATRRRAYLADGIDQLLRYCAEQPDLLGADRPGGWLVAPPSDVFACRPATTGAPLWIATADEVADAAVARMTAGGGRPAGRPLSPPNSR